MQNVVGQEKMLTLEPFWTGKTSLFEHTTLQLSAPAATVLQSLIDSCPDTGLPPDDTTVLPCSDVFSRTIDIMKLSTGKFELGHAE